MDDIVKQAMVKWPAVPAVYGWLSLDRRGNWLIKGDRVSNPVLAGFINRNYGHDHDGRWFFQNGPQRVFVALDYAPLAFRLGTNGDPRAPLRIEAHTGTAVAAVSRAWVDDAGAALLETALGPGLVDDRDLDRLLPCFTNARGDPLADDAIVAAFERLQSTDDADLYFRYADRPVPVARIAASDVPSRLGFVQNPAPPPAHEPCA